LSHPIIQRISDSGAAQLAWSGLTPELLEKARGRVRTVAWLLLAVTALGSVIDITYGAITLGTVDLVLVAAGVVGTAMSVAMVVVANHTRIGHLAALHAALVYEVALCFLLSVGLPYVTLQEVGEVPYMTWVTPVIIMFPLIVPSPPRLTLVAAIASAATRPLGLVVLAQFVGVDIPGERFFASTFSPLFAVAVAYLGSRIVHGMNVDLAQARRMGSYQLEERLGEGGMGEVWRASHQFLARPAAVKLVRPETIAGDFGRQQVMHARFEREAQTTALLSSPHTIQLFDFGVEPRGAFYYVMELLDGLDLQRLVRQFGPMPAARAVHLLRQVCDSLAEAHEHGLIHRDIKPANIYVCRHARQVDFVKVLDFGLVKLHGAEDESNPKLTADHVVGGTPAFIAPEQVLGQEVDARADIYSLGCVTYWMVTGTCVFEGPSPVATMTMHVHETPQPPSARAEQPISPSFERLVLSCMEKDPANRPQDADRLAELLAECDVGDPWTAERAKRWWARHLPEVD
jgi:serine/threonine-protein kinase